MYEEYKANIECSYSGNGEKYITRSSGTLGALIPSGFAFGH
jgi:hypothetical protein